MRMLRTCALFSQLPPCCVARAAAFSTATHCIRPEAQARPLDIMAEGAACDLMMQATFSIRRALLGGTAFAAVELTRAAAADSRS